MSVELEYGFRGLIEKSPETGLTLLNVNLKPRLFGDPSTVAPDPQEQTPNDKDQQKYYEI